jgi:hypothetical protein
MTATAVTIMNTDTTSLALAFGLIVYLLGLIYLTLRLICRGAATAPWRRW